MKNFLKAWLAELPKLLTSELGLESTLEPMSGLPPTGKLLALEVLCGSSQRLLVAVDAGALATVLVTAQVTSSDRDEERDRELWAGMLQQVGTRAASALSQATPEMPEIRVQATEMRGSSFDWHILRVGEARVPLAVRLENIAAPPASRPDASVSAAAAPATSTNKGPTEDRPGRPEVAPDVPAAGRNATWSSRGLDLLLDVELEASLRFGSREMTLNEVLDLGAGDVVELERHVADPVDLLVGNKIVARGEVVLVNGCFGLRVTEVAEPTMRLESIRCLF